MATQSPTAVMATQSPTTVMAKKPCTCSYDHLNYRAVRVVPAKNIRIHLLNNDSLLKSDLYYLIITKRNKQIFAFTELRCGGVKMFIIYVGFLLTSILVQPYLEKGTMPNTTSILFTWAQHRTSWNCLQQNLVHLLPRFPKRYNSFLDFGRENCQDYLSLDLRNWFVFFRDLLNQFVFI